MEEGERFVMRERMRALTFEVIVRAVFGVTERERIERLRSALVSVLDMQAVLFLPDMLRRDLGRFSPWGQFQRRLQAADALIYEEIALRRSEPDLEDRTDVLSLLLRARDEDDQPMTDVELRDELMTMLLAGHETTATGLAFAFDLLLRNPRVLGRLREELIAGDDTYLDAVVSETLRLRPVIDANARTLTKPARSADGTSQPVSVSTRRSRSFICARISTRSPTSSVQSGSSTVRRSPTLGFPSVAASVAASARRSPRPRWLR